MASAVSYGFSVAVSGDVIVVGAHGQDPAPYTDIGAAYAFHRDQGGDGTLDPCRRNYSTGENFLRHFSCDGGSGSLDVVGGTVLPPV